MTICINLFLLTDRNSGNTVHSEMLSSDKTLKYSLSLENMGLSSLGTSTSFNNPAEFITGECCENSTVSPGGRVGDVSSGEVKSGEVHSTGLLSNPRWISSNSHSLNTLRLNTARTSPANNCSEAPESGCLSW